MKTKLKEEHLVGRTGAEKQEINSEESRLIIMGYTFLCDAILWTLSSIEYVCVNKHNGIICR